LIGASGEQVGIVSLAAANKLAEEAELDLVEIAPTAAPPVCRIMDYGKYKYELQKKEHQSRRHQKSTSVKEIKLRPRTDKHDLEIKVRQIKGFLADGNKTKVTLTFRGREMANQEMGRSVMSSVIAELTPVGTIEYAPRMEGRNLIMVVAPKS
jgi:translation initiation factor IF-3